MAEFNVKMLASWVTVLMLIGVVVSGGTEKEAADWLKSLQAPYNEIFYKHIVKSWEATINITEETAKARDEISKEFLKFDANILSELLEKFPNWEEFKDRRLRRAFKYMSLDGWGNMSLDRVHKLKQMKSKMVSAYSTTTVCEYNNQSNCKLQQKDIELIMNRVTDPKELAYYFDAWHDAMSAAVPPEFYKEFTDILTEAAMAKGYQYHSEKVMVMYDADVEGWNFSDFRLMQLHVAENITRSFDILHAYVRMKLRKMPEFEGMIQKCGYIPAHITGPVSGQDWTIFESRTKPFPDAPEVDATASMLAQGYTTLRMFQESDKFYKEMGLKGVSEEFWNKSIFEKPADGRQMNCHPAAFDMGKGPGSTDFRIRMCANVTQMDFAIIHHEMGHFRQYTDLEYVFRDSANPGFHEAVGDALALAVVTPKHLQCKLNLDLGLPKSLCDHDTKTYNVTEHDMNYLYRIALEKLAVFPFACSMDMWRWFAWEGNIPVYDYNKMWWRIVQDFYGVYTPTDRSSSKLFDPAANYHIVANVDYTRYYISHIAQFQFYEAMCIAAKEFDPNDPLSKPLFQCDFAGSKEAGKLMENMMKMGFSVGWPTALEALTGTRELSIEPLQRYLAPLLDYMEKELKANGEVIGFGDSCNEVKRRKGLSRWSLLLPPEIFDDNF